MKKIYRVVALFNGYFYMHFSIIHSKSNYICMNAFKVLIGYRLYLCTRGDEIEQKTHALRLTCVFQMWTRVESKKSESFQTCR